MSKTSVPSGRAARLAQGLMLLLLTVGFFAVLAEGALAVTGRYSPAPYWFAGDHPSFRGRETDTLVGWTIGPDRVSRTGWSREFDVTYRSDETGFRRPAGDWMRPPEVPLVFLGDSFTFGNGVEYEETFAALTGAALDVPVRNLGMSGYGLDQIWQAFRYFGRPARPRVVVAAWIDDDLRRSLSAYRERGEGWWEKPTFTLQGDSLVRQRASDRPVGVTRWIARRSRLVQLVRSAVWAAAIRHAAGPAWELNAVILDALRRDVEEVGAHLLVVRIPQKRQSGPSPMTGALARRGFDVVDLGALLPEDASALYYRTDPHFNAAGHRWAAEQIVRHLRAHGWPGA